MQKLQTENMLKMINVCYHNVGLLEWLHYEFVYC